jgi:hypothetical protein
MRHWFATVALVGLLSAPAFAGESNGFQDGDVTIYTRSGGIIHMMITDKKLLDEITRDAMVLPDDPMIVVHNGKTYMVKDRMMPNGHMLSQVMTTPNG